MTVLQVIAEVRQGFERPAVANHLGSRDPAAGSRADPAASAAPDHDLGARAGVRVARRRNEPPTRCRTVVLLEGDIVAARRGPGDRLTAGGARSLRLRRPGGAGHRSPRHAHLGSRSVVVHGLCHHPEPRQRPRRPAGVHVAGARANTSMGKRFDTFSPCGRYVVTLDEFASRVRHRAHHLSEWPAAAAQPHQLADLAGGHTAELSVGVDDALLPRRYCLDRYAICAWRSRGPPSPARRLNHRPYNGPWRFDQRCGQRRSS